MMIGLHWLLKIGEYHCLLPTNSYKTSLKNKVACLLHQGFKGSFTLHYFKYFGQRQLSVSLLEKSVTIMEEKGWNVE